MWCNLELLLVPLCPLLTPNQYGFRFSINKYKIWSSYLKKESTQGTLANLLGRYCSKTISQGCLNSSLGSYPIFTPEIIVESSSYLGSFYFFFFGLDGALWKQKQHVYAPSSTCLFFFFLLFSPSRMLERSEWTSLSRGSESLFFSSKFNFPSCSIDAIYINTINIPFRDLSLF